MSIAVNKLLVVLDDNLDDFRTPAQSALLMRAAEFARATGCDLELLQVCHNSALRNGVYADVEKARQVYMQPYAAQLAEIVAWLRPYALAVSQDIRWGYPRAKAIARKIEECGCDLVMKACRARSHVYGCLTSTDRELVLSSAVPLWFCHSDHRTIEAVVAGVRPHLGTRLSSAANLDVLRWALAAANSYAVPVHIVHGCASVNSRTAQRCMQAASVLQSGSRVERVVVSECDTMDVLPMTVVAAQSSLVVISDCDVHHLAPAESRTSPFATVLAEIQSDILVVHDRPRPMRSRKSLRDDLHCASRGSSGQHYRN